MHICLSAIMQHSKKDPNNLKLHSFGRGPPPPPVCLMSRGQPKFSLVCVHRRPFFLICQKKKCPKKHSLYTVQQLCCCLFLRALKNTRKKKIIKRNVRWRSRPLRTCYSRVHSHKGKPNTEPRSKWCGLITSRQQKKTSELQDMSVSQAGRGRERERGSQGEESEDLLEWGERRKRAGEWKNQKESWSRSHNFLGAVAIGPLGNVSFRCHCCYFVSKELCHCT